MGLELGLGLGLELGLGLGLGFGLGLGLGLELRHHLAAVGSVAPVLQRHADLRRAVALGLQRQG